MALKIYNTLSRQLEDFKPRTPGKVTMYVCGVTVYASSHIGHAMSAITFDVIRRYLEYKGFEVRHVINFTDIDDKIIRRAQEEKVDWHVLTERYVKEYLDWMDALNVKRATVYPRATQEIPYMIEAIQDLINKGFAYESNGDVYYRVLAKPEYGELKHQSLDELMAGARVEIGEAKENELDFALWKAAKPGEPSWPSPWGEGRPGWHIECSVMALRHLDTQLDIHGGGTDLIFPHHENEIAQSEALTGHRPFSKYWMHNGMLQAKVQDPETGKWVVEKMSKSLGNTLSVGDILSKGDPDMLRMFVLGGSRYRNLLTYTDESFDAAFQSLERLKSPFAPAEKWPDPTSEEGNAAASSALIQAAESAQSGFEAAMDDDFNTPVALSKLFELKTEIFKGRDSGASGAAIQQAREILAELGGILGLRMKEVPQATTSQDTAPFIELLVEVRRDLKAARQFALADKIRDQLKDLGVKLEDRPDGTVWKFEK
ncbi:MAG TPA: cysteine--tRNA ligase [Chloroflexia bacterium]|nr:cysteine--tRNA ligase [Chloroflexia bacterium]